MQHGWIAMVGEWVKLVPDVGALVGVGVKCSRVDVRWSECWLDAARLY